MYHTPAVARWHGKELRWEKRRVCFKNIYYNHTAAAEQEHNEILHVGRTSAARAQALALAALALAGLALVLLPLALVLLPLATRTVFLAAAFLVLGALVVLGTLKFTTLRKMGVWRSRVEERSPSLPSLPTRLPSSQPSPPAQQPPRLHQRPPTRLLSPPLR